MAGTGARIVLVAGFLLHGAGCATNPVTGRSELSLMSESQELAIGQENYGKMQQAQGGSEVAFPAISAYVSDVGQRLARVSDRPNLPYEFVVLNNDIPNAWALPGGKIAVNRGLLVELRSEAELAAVLSHEIVHAAARHSAKSVERGMLMQAGVVGLGLALENHDYRDLIVGGAGISGQLIGLKYGRDDEREADGYGMKYMAAAGYDPAAAVELQETFVRLAQGGETGWLTGMLSSHPPSRERVERNRAAAQNYPPGGFRGEEEYRRVIEPLIAAAAAYEMMAKGYEALGNGEAGGAFQLALRAIAREPREGHFYALAAKSLMALQQDDQAVAMLDKAIARNGDYFDYYLQRGMALQKLGQIRDAQRDFDRNARLLPTAQAHHALGILALNAGNRNAAVQHFRVAASSSSADGEQSALMLTRLDLPENSERYFEITLERDRAGYLIVSATNLSPLPVTDLQVVASVYDSRRPARHAGPDLVPGHDPERPDIVCPHPHRHLQIR